MKAIHAISHEGVEPDRFDNLPEEIRFATECLKNNWCPANAKKRLSVYLRKAIDLQAKVSLRHSDDG